ncbi:MAG: VKc protein, partial [Thermodesulfobacteriota bacterium]|nr:VKc protein [Thermodesulfobacteriota bacterium]
MLPGNAENTGLSHEIQNKPHIGPGVFAFFLSLSLVGIFATSFLSYRHVLLTAEYGSVPESTLCRPTATVNCDAVLQTQFAVLFDYFPSSVVGLAGFVMLFWFASNGLMIPRLRSNALINMVVYLSLAIVFSAYFSYLMIFEVDFVCTWCIVVHAVNLVALCSAIFIARKKRAVLEYPSQATVLERTYLVISAFLAGTIVIVGIGWIEKSVGLVNAQEKYEKLAKDPQVVKVMVLASPDYKVSIDDKDPVYGSPQAPYPIILFTDLQCPVCLRQEIFLRAMVDLNPEHLRLVLKNYPLSTNCNRKLAGNLHPLACEAATAAYASFLLGGDGIFWHYIDLILAHQNKLDNKL